MTQTSLDNKKVFSFFVMAKYSVYRHLLLQMMILIISVSVFFDSPDTVNLSINRCYGWLGYFLFMNMLVYFNVYILFPYFLRRDKIRAYMFSVIGFACFALGIVVILQSFFYDIAVAQTETGVLAISLSIMSSFFAILLFIIGMSTILLFQPFMLNLMKEDQLKLDTVQSELTFLKSQINPHFLFNTINNANFLIEEEPDLAIAMLTKLDDLLIYQFNDSIKEQVSLSADIQFLRDYLDLEQTRHDQLDYTIELEGEFKGIAIAPFLFIPLVENAVKHNANSLAFSYIKLSFTIDGQTLLFVCENTKATNPITKHSPGGIGLPNLKRRLNLLYPGLYTLEKTETPSTYFVQLKLHI